MGESFQVQACIVVPICCFPSDVPMCFGHQANTSPPLRASVFTLYCVRDMQARIYATAILPEVVIGEKEKGARTVHGQAGVGVGGSFLKNENSKHRLER